MAESDAVLRDFAKTIRSKNAAPYRLTLDVIFRDSETFQKVLASNSLTREAVADAYGVGVEAISSWHVFEAGHAVKCTLTRTHVQGHLGESDMYGAQQHVPLMNLPIALDLSAASAARD